MKLLAKQTSIETICQIKSEFAVNWIPVLSWLIMAPNSAVRHGQDFADFSSSHGFTHVTCSSKPMMKQTIKQLLKKSKDLYLALLMVVMYRATPLQNGLFPSNHFSPKSLKPATANHGSQQRKTGSQLQPLAHCNRAPAPARWSSLDQGPEMIRQCCCSIHSPHSYIIKTQRGTVRHNWAAIVSTPAAGPTSSQWQQCRQDCTYHPHLCSHLFSPTPSHQQLLLLHHRTFQPADNSAHEIWNMCE